jgi:hypothetical protein
LKLSDRTPSDEAADAWLAGRTHSPTTTPEEVDAVSAKAATAAKALPALLSREKQLQQEETQARSTLRAAVIEALRALRTRAADRAAAAAREINSAYGVVCAVSRLVPAPVNSGEAFGLDVGLSKLGIPHLGFESDRTRGLAEINFHPMRSHASHPGLLSATAAAQAGLTATLLCVAEEPPAKLLAPI